MNERTHKPVVVGIGEVLWDVLPEGRRLGGAPANFAYHAQQQGVEVFVVSAVGNDGEGQSIIAELAGRGLATQYIATVPAYPTGTVSVELTDGIPSYNIHAPVAWDFIPWSDPLKQLAGLADAVCFGTLAQRNSASLATIQRFLAHARPDCLKVFDVNLRQNFYNQDLIETSLNLCDLLKISDEELPAVADMFGLNGSDDFIAAELLKMYNLIYLVLTKGKDGGILYYDDKVVHVPAYDYGPRVDTVGCGDSFTAALTVGLLLGLPPEEAMTHASRIAGLVCASHGAMPDIPASLRLIVES